MLYLENSGAGEPPTPQGKKAQYSNTKDSQRARFGDGRDGGKEAMRLTVNPISKIKGIGAAIHAANTKVEGPKA